MLSNAYFLAKFRFDTAENEPAKNLQNFAKFANFADPSTVQPRLEPELGRASGPSGIGSPRGEPGAGLLGTPCASHRADCGSHGRTFELAG